ncbi:MAG: hypothetical protein RLZZ260_784 [Actinomycetota bacterium]
MRFNVSPLLLCSSMIAIFWPGSPIFAQESNRLRSALQKSSTWHTREFVQIALHMSANSGGSST